MVTDDDVGEWGHVSVTCTSAYQANKTAAPRWITKPLSVADSRVKNLRGAAGEFYNENLCEKVQMDGWMYKA